MSRLAYASLLCLLATAALADEPKPPKGFTALFSGKDLSGWRGMMPYDPSKLDKLSAEERNKKLDEWTAEAKKHWTARKGELVYDGEGPYLATARDYGDFELLVEFRTAAKADGGVALRGYPEVRISGSDTGSGGLSSNAKGSPGRDPLVRADRSFGEWNRFRIVMVGERVTVHLNDKLVVDHARLENHFDRKLPLPRKGPIQLRTPSGEVRWRNVYIREIPADEANTILKKHGAKGFEDVFNGKDFTGWAGPLENYEVKEGAIVCKPKKGGNIHTKAEYDDFVARVEYRLPAGGNNGLAIRYPGKGQPSQVAMCEVQVLDDDAAQYKKLDPRQYNGSVYGMVAAHRGYLRPVGEWNFMEVTVRGPTIAVELNGTRIVDADVSKVKTFLSGKHEGKDRTKGHFGFCGHNDPVAFRLVQIKKLAAKKSE
jgi:hypothetical protein